MQEKPISHHITIYIERYKKAFAQKREEFCLRCPKMWVAKDWVLLNSNTLVHYLVLMQQQLAKQFYGAFLRHHILPISNVTFASLCG
jgi:hypothetical protein